MRLQADAAFLPLFFPDDPTLGRGVYYVAGGTLTWLYLLTET